MDSQYILTVCSVLIPLVSLYLAFLTYSKIKIKGINYAVVILIILLSMMALYGIGYILFSNISEPQTVFSSESDQITQTEEYPSPTIINSSLNKSVGNIVEASSKNSKTLGYIRTNEYIENGIEPMCEPGSRQATCSSPDSCVDCMGKCWPAGSYNSDSGVMICSEGKWTLSGYLRTNEYSLNSLMPNCTPGSMQAICPTRWSCVGCDGKCWAPGSYNSGTLKCSQGKWTIIGYPRVNEYAPNSTEPICEPGSKRTICSSPDSCVDCNGKCWSPGIYDTDHGSMICSQGKWTLF